MCSAFCFPVQTYAQSADDFSTTLTSTYSISAHQTRVTHRLIITNQSPVQYLNKYALRVATPHAKDVRVSTNGEAITPEVVSTNTSTAISFTFPDKVVGEGKQRELEISYLDDTTAIASGKVLEVSVPRVDELAYSSYTLILITPAEYGEPTRVTPETYTTVREGTSLVTTIPITSGHGATALFGKEQWFQMHVDYDLRNPSQNTSLAQITLPPDTNHQTMYYQQLDPPPMAMELDPDGNWIATYQLPAQTNMAVTAEAVAAIHLNSTPLPSQKIPSAVLTAPQTYWEIGDNRLQAQAAQLPNVRAIYDFVVATLSYDYSQTSLDRPRLGAVGALLEPTRAVCTEFTDVFIALARAKNIPARRVLGYAYSQNQTLRPLLEEGDVLHAWPEYFDQAAQDWMQVDPTWEKTTGGVNFFDVFDLSHIALAIQGHSSTVPFAAGNSFTTGSKRKMVHVDFASSLPTISPNWQVEILPRRIAGIPLPGLYTLHLTNPTGRAWYTVSIAPHTTDRDTQVSTVPNQTTILPFQTVTIPISVTTRQLTPHQTNVTLNITDAYNHQPITSTTGLTAISLVTAIISAGVALGTLIVTGTLLARRLLVRRRRR